MRILLDPMPGQGSSGSPYETGNMADEPGAVSNRASYDPNDSRWSDTVSKWDDGQTYDVTMRLRQMSPGEAEITAIKSAATPTDDDESAETDDSADAAPAPAASSDNPAIANLD